ncbi:hypothetical protein ACFE04_010961 [Oxalis oulophora]
MKLLKVFVDHPAYHRPENPYGDSFGAFGDNQFRFTLLCHAACEAPLVLPLGGYTYGEKSLFLAPNKNIEENGGSEVQVKVDKRCDMFGCATNEIGKIIAFGSPIRSFVAMLATGLGTSFGGRTKKPPFWPGYEAARTPAAELLGPSNLRMLGTIGEGIPGEHLPTNQVATKILVGQLYMEVIRVKESSSFINYYDRDVIYLRVNGNLKSFQAISQVNEVYFALEVKNGARLPGRFSRQSNQLRHYRNYDIATQAALRIEDYMYLCRESVYCYKEGLSCEWNLYIDFQSKMKDGLDTLSILAGQFQKALRAIKCFLNVMKFSVEEAIKHQLDALKYNDQPRPDYRIEVMYRFAGFDPFERSTYFGWFFDLGQFERFRRIYHHSTYRVLLGHKERKILSSLFIEENKFKQRVWVRGSRPQEEEIFQFTMAQRIGGSWDGYWLIESVLNDGGDAFAGGMAY